MLKALYRSDQNNYARIWVQVGLCLLVSFSVQAGELDHLSLPPLLPDHPPCEKCQKKTYDAHQLTCKGKHIFCEECLEPYKKNEYDFPLVDDTITVFGDTSDRSYPVFCPTCNHGKTGTPARAVLLGVLKKLKVYCRNCEQEDYFVNHLTCAKKKPSAGARQPDVRNEGDSRNRVFSPLPSRKYESDAGVEATFNGNKTCKNCIRRQTHQYFNGASAGITSPVENSCILTGTVSRVPDSNEFEWTITNAGSKGYAFWEDSDHEYFRTLEINYNINSVSWLSGQFASGIYMKVNSFRVIAFVSNQNGRFSKAFPINSFSPITSSLDPSFSNIQIKSLQLPQSQYVRSMPSISVPDISVYFYIYPVSDTLTVGAETKSAKWSIQNPKELLAQTSFCRKPILSEKFSLYVNPDSRALNYYEPLEMQIVYGPVAHINSSENESIEIGIALPYSKKAIDKMLSQNLLRIYAEDFQGQRKMVHECGYKDFLDAGSIYLLSSKKLSKKYASPLSGQPVTFIVQVERYDKGYTARSALKVVGGVLKALLPSDDPTDSEYSVYMGASEFY